MLTALAAAALTVTTAQIPQPAAKVENAYSRPANSTLGAVTPTPGAWVLMGLGGLALIRASRKPKTSN